MSIQPVRGTKDLLPAEARKFRHISDWARAVTELFGYAEMATPIFEFSEVFKKGLGESTDIIGKEMYSFLDRGGDELSLRPEGTAGVVRAFISEGLAQNLPLKVFYQGPMFRYERPQKGRQRQFHQIGVECLGIDSPQADSECIAMAQMLLQKLGIDSKCQLEINSIGDRSSRARYRQALVDFFSQHEKSLSEDSQKRLHTNPMRILDSKHKADQALVSEAPLLSDYLSPEAKDFFEQVTLQLKALGLKPQLNPRLVRGLDYYCHTVFEFKTSELGAQDAVLSGGRYDGLVEMMGGPATAGVGWAAGMERLALLLDQEIPAPRPQVIIPLGNTPEIELEALKLAHLLREQGFVVESTYSGNLQKRLKRANRLKARAALLLGPEEVQKSQVTVKDLDTGEQKTLAQQDLAQALKDFA